MVATCISPLYCAISTGVHWLAHEVHRPVHQLISLIQDPTIRKTEAPVAMATQWGEWLDIWGEGCHCSWEAQDCTHPGHLSYPHLHQQKLCCSFLLHLMLQNLDLPISWQEGIKIKQEQLQVTGCCSMIAIVIIQLLCLCLDAEQQSVS